MIKTKINDDKNDDTKRKVAVEVKIGTEAQTAIETEMVTECSCSTVRLNSLLNNSMK